MSLIHFILLLRWHAASGDGNSCMLDEASRSVFKISILFCCSCCIATGVLLALNDCVCVCVCGVTEINMLTLCGKKSLNICRWLLPVFRLWSSNRLFPLLVCSGCQMSVSVCAIQQTNSELLHKTIILEVSIISLYIFRYSSGTGCKFVQYKQWGEQQFNCLAAFEARVTIAVCVWNTKRKVLQ